MRAQAIIAVCNTVLTAAGLWFFGVPIGYYVISVLTQHEEGLGAEPSASTKP